ncbi:maleylpyruvate isomerase family mycothiol-dependent enzyme [Streptomyces sp. BPTC-684]|uniref:maleylpyruvate isomerase family mycothiol-dependent enzyme n=1 Tax=Streptomyces sp. BPTC-684 TaxID=3043734 RepID=UPI0024B159EB|nr:maleylpyruvate isomerase family mycothiol-dependent enzyme [Streptomyces sp. BPTC-684]WHM37580.1 sterol carrier family protein [Streptomyces sp. BPTC-684]
MPPAKKRTRSYDPGKTRAAVLAQFAHVREAVARLAPDVLERPTRLAGWTVYDLAAHLARAVDVVARNLAEPAPAPGRPEITLPDWPFATAAAAVRTPDAQLDLAALYADVAARTGRLLPGAEDTRLVRTALGTMTLADHLVTRTVELCVHTDDLNDAVPGLDIPYERQALAACTRLLADALAVKAPGGSVEVRIPPYAVVQCVEGPKHTRGTPPNVVETDPLTWIRLAAGRRAWADERDGGRVSASGERADLSALLPVLSR